MNLAPIPVVFIPALLSDAQLYDDVIATLGDAIAAEVMISPQPRLADSVAEILARAPRQFVLAGTSYGASLALEIALAAPDRVIALWLMGSNPAAPESGGSDLAGGLEATPDAVIEMLSGLVVRPQATAKAATFRAMAHRTGGPAGAAQARAMATRAEATSRLGSLTMPALIVWGNDDAIVPVAVGRALAADLPNAEFHGLDDCGHLPTLEKPVESARLFSAFLAKLR